MVQDHRLAWGDITLSEPSTSPTSDGWMVEAMADQTQYGNPSQIVEIVQSLLTDGSLAVVQRWENREATIRLRLSAPSEEAGPALAAAEAALMDQLQQEPRPPALVWTPPATNASVTVFDAVSANLDRDTAKGWAVAEAGREVRYYLLTLNAAPFARPEDRIIVPALTPNPGSPTTSLIDDCTSATNWAADADGFGTVTRTNLVKNPSFETGKSNWTKGGGDFFDRQYGSAQSGDWNAVVSAGNQQAAEIYTTIDVTAGLDYAASAYLTVAYAGEEGDVALQWRNSSGDVISQDDSTNITSGGGFQRVSVVATAPSGAVSARVRCRSVRPSSGDLLLRVDAVLVEQASSVGTYFDGDTAAAGTTDYYWTGTPHASTSTVVTEPTVAVVSGAVEVDSVATKYGEGARHLTLIRSTAASMSTLPYLRAAVNFDVSYNLYDATYRIDGSQVYPIASAVSAISGHTDLYFETGDFTAFDVEVTNVFGEGSAAAISVADLTATDTLPGLTKQKARLTQVSGSARTQAALRLYDDTTGELGRHSLIYTSSDTAWQPNLRQDWLVSSAATTSNTGTVSGVYNDMSSDMVFRIPASLLSRGLYSLMLRLWTHAGGADADVTWTMKLTDAAGSDVLGSDQELTDTLTIPGFGANSFEIIPIGAMHLPPVATEGAQYVELTLSSTLSSMEVDDLWLFNLTDGALTWFDDTGPPTVRWLEIRSPGLDAPQPAVYGSASGDGSDAVAVSHLCKSFGIHEFRPGLMQIFTVTTTSDESKSEIEFYPHYHSHVP